jgi:hypothetical protein
MKYEKRRIGFFLQKLIPPAVKNCAFFVPAVSKFTKKTLTFPNLMEIKKANAVNDHPRSGWLQFSRLARRGKAKAHLCF